MGEVIAEEAFSVGFQPVKPWGEPVLGAVLLAARLGGAELDVAAYCGPQALGPRQLRIQLQ